MIFTATHLEPQNSEDPPLIITAFFIPFHSRHTAVFFFIRQVLRINFRARKQYRCYQTRCLRQRKSRCLLAKSSQFGVRLLDEARSMVAVQGTAANFWAGLKREGLAQFGFPREIYQSKDSFSISKPLNSALILIYSLSPMTLCLILISQSTPHSAHTSQPPSPPPQLWLPSVIA